MESEGEEDVIEADSDEEIGDVDKEARLHEIRVAAGKKAAATRKAHAKQQVRFLLFALFSVLLQIFFRSNPKKKKTATKNPTASPQKLPNVERKLPNHHLPRKLVPHRGWQWSTGNYCRPFYTLLHVKVTVV